MEWIICVIIQTEEEVFVLMWGRIESLEVLGTMSGQILRLDGDGSGIPISHWKGEW